jgi:hypothetical protein
VTLPQQLVDQLKAKTGSQAGLISTNMTVGLTISGTVQKPDQLDANVSLALNGGALKIQTELIAVDGNLYYKNPMSGKWEIFKRPARSSASPSSKPKLSYQTLLDNSKVTEVTDASSTLNGTTVEHYRIVPDLAKLFAQISAGHTSSNSAGMAAIQAVLQSASLQADVWTGTSDHLIRRLTYDADVSADLHQLAAALGSEATSKMPAFNLPAGSMARVTAHVQIDLHDFNSKLTIKAPAVG